MELTQDKFRASIQFFPFGVATLKYDICLLTGLAVGMVGKGYRATLTGPVMVLVVRGEVLPTHPVSNIHEL